mgnify:FL=1
MTLNIRPRRSLLYMPASNPRAIEKSRNLPADVLIFDLEDSVSPEKKDLARNEAIKAVNSGNYPSKELLIRVNGIETEWLENDIKQIVSSDAHGVLIPKVSSIKDILFIEDILDDYGAKKDFSLWAMMETPKGILSSNEIAKASNRLKGFCIGTADLSKELGCSHPSDRSPMILSLQMVILSARANGLVVIDGVHINLDDDDGYRASCIQGKELGFDGKSLIHPKQIELANTLFSPSKDEIAHAKEIIFAHETALKHGKGVITHNGKLVEVLHVEQAKDLLVKASAIADLEKEN